MAKGNIYIELQVSAEGLVKATKDAQKALHDFGKAIDKITEVRIKIKQVQPKKWWQIFILFILFGVLVSCEKEQILPCAEEQYFTVDFRNDNLLRETLWIDYLAIDVRHVKRAQYHVPVDFERLALSYFVQVPDSIAAIYVWEKRIWTMPETYRPNACATFNLW